MLHASLAHTHQLACHQVMHAQLDAYLHINFTLLRMSNQFYGNATQAAFALQLQRDASTVVPALWQAPHRHHLLALLELELKACKW